MLCRLRFCFHCHVGQGRDRKFLCNTSELDKVAQIKSEAAFLFTLGGALYTCRSNRICSSLKHSGAPSHDFSFAWKQVWACDLPWWDLRSNRELHFMDLTMGAMASLCQSTAHWWMECFEQLRSPEKESGRGDWMCSFLWDSTSKDITRGQESTFQCGICLFLTFCLSSFKLLDIQLPPPLYLPLSKSFFSVLWL